MTSRAELLAEASEEAISFNEATREKVGLLIGIWAESGGGKTLTALILARALARHDGEDWNDPEVLKRIDQRIAYIDTDGGRALHYAVAPGELPRLDLKNPSFAFRHADFKPPFSPERMQNFIERAEAAGFEVIITDSFSLIWEGEGGVKDIHDADAEAAVARAWKRYEEGGRRGKEPNEDSIRGDAGHWKNAKTRNRAMVVRMLQSRAHLIFCGHADDKMSMESKTESFEKGGRTISYQKTEVTAAKDLPPAERWVPIVEKKFPRQLAISIVLDPASPGVPIPKKPLNVQMRDFVPLDRPIDYEVGLKLSAWAHGASLDAMRPGRAESGKPVSASGAPSSLDAPSGAAENPPTTAPPPLEDEQGSLGGDDFFPGDVKLVELWGAAFNPALPKEIALPGEVSDAEWKAYGEALRQLIATAPSAVLMTRWSEANAEGLARLKKRSVKLWTWTLEPIGERAPA